MSCKTTAGAAAGLRDTFGSGRSTINLNSGLGKALTWGCGHQIFIFLFGCVCAAIWRCDCTPCRPTRVRWDLASAGAAGCTDLPCLCRDPRRAASTAPPLASSRCLVIQPDCPNGLPGPQVDTSCFDQEGGI